MDATTEVIVDFVRQTTSKTVPSVAMREAVRHFVDGVGCAAGGLAAAPVRIAREMAVHDRSDLNAMVYGLEEPVALSSAAFANGCANRHLDFNDTYLKVPAGHPNDMVPALFALAEAASRSGKDFLTSTYIAYEVFGGISDVAPVRDRGWDQGLQCSLGVAAGGAFLLGLDANQTANALSIAITPSIPLRVVRTGELSQWKGCATAHAAMTAISALRMASRGMTGPPEPFEGVDGLWQQATGPFKLVLGGDSPSALERTLIKHVPSELSSQVPVQIVLSLRDKVRIDEVATIHITTHHLGWHEIGGGQGDGAEKWDPQTRETADHSLPYIVAVALVDGSITPHSFALDRVRDPSLRPLIQKITVAEDPMLTAGLRDRRELGAHITVTHTDGGVVEGHGLHPLGSPDNPMSDDDIRAKAAPMIDDVLSPAGARELGERLWSVAEADLVGEIADLFSQFGSASKP